MSGGSYDYLCFNADDLGRRRGDLACMAERLEGLPWAAQAAADTRRCLKALDEASALAERLSDAWRAIEWWDSGDYGEDSAREEVEGYEPLDGRRVDDVQYRLVDVGNGVFELRPIAKEGEGR